MNTEEVLKQSPLIGKSVKVTNEDYIDGGYTGIISAISTETFLVEHVSGSNGWENHEWCEIIE